MKFLRASGIHLAIACPPSALPDDMPISETSDAARLGTAAHDGQARQAQGQTVDVPALARLHDVDEGELSFLLGNGAMMLGRLHAPELADADVEMPLSVVLLFDLVGSVGLAGTLDYLWIKGRDAGCVDWKSGRKDADYRDQLMAYAVLVFGHYPTVDNITATVAWMRDAEEETYVITREDIPAWQDRLGNSLRTPDQYRPGEHCGFCPRKFGCPALLQRQRQMIAVFNPGLTQSQTIRELSPAHKIELYRQAAEVTRLAEYVKADIKADIAEHGPIESDTHVLRLTEENQRVIDPLKGWDALQGALTDNEMAKAVHVSISAAEEAVGKRAPRGMAAAAKRELGAALAAAGAVRMRAVTKVREMRKA